MKLNWRFRSLDTSTFCPWTCRRRRNATAYRRKRFRDDVEAWTWPMPDANRYDILILQVFRKNYKTGDTEFEFDRSELEHHASKQGIALPKNLGDVIYSYRYRRKLPEQIRATASKKMEWIIEPAGRSKYRFRLSRSSRIVPRTDLLAVKIPDAT